MSPRASNSPRKLSIYTSTYIGFFFFFGICLSRPVSKGKDKAIGNVAIDLDANCEEGNDSEDWDRNELDIAFKRSR